MNLISDILKPLVSVTILTVLTLIEDDNALKPEANVYMSI